MKIVDNVNWIRDGWIWELTQFLEVVYFDEMQFMIANYVRTFILIMLFTKNIEDYFLLPFKLVEILTLVHLNDFHDEDFTRLVNLATDIFELNDIDFVGNMLEYLKFRQPFDKFLQKLFWVSFFEKLFCYFYMLFINNIGLNFSCTCLLQRRLIEHNTAWNVIRFQNDGGGLSEHIGAVIRSFCEIGRCSTFIKWVH